MELTSREEDLMGYVNEHIKEDGREYFYAECDEHDCKPWRRRDVLGLQEKGLVRIEEVCEDVFYVYLPDSPEREKSLDEKLDDFENEMNEILAPSMEFDYPEKNMLSNGIARSWRLSVIDPNGILHSRSSLSVDHKFVEVVSKVADKHGIKVHENNDRTLFWVM